MNQNLKVGLMTLVTSAVLIYMVYVIGDFSFSERGYNFTISFYAVNGWSKGSNVSMSGVKIGKVTSIEIVDDQVYVHDYILPFILVLIFNQFSIWSKNIRINGRFYLALIIFGWVIVFVFFFSKLNK